MTFIGAAVAGAEKAKVEWKPLSVGGMQEIGQLQKGIWKDINEPFRDEWVDHFGTFLTQEALVDGKLRITVGLGGIFQFPKPEVAQSEFGGSQYKAFFIGPTIAEGVYRPDGAGEDGFEVGLGMFPFKYNQDARNLGEYLFRSGPYPSYLTTGGFSITNHASAPLQGMRARWARGRFSLDGLALTETGMPPLYDGSLAALLGWSSAGGLVEVGAGANLKRILPVRPGRTTPRNLGNAYFNRGGTWYPGTPEEFKARAAFAQARGQGAQAEAYNALADSILYWTTTDSVLDATSGATVAYAKPRLRYFSSQGNLFMVRASLDFKALIPSKYFGSEDMRVFAEAALLGWRNYPLYYTDRSRRMPVMAGVNLPGFKVLDLISFQVERFDSPYANNFLSLGNAKATPYFPGGTNGEFSRKAYYDAASEDDYSWSLLLRKRILPGLDAHAQFARDHLRTVGTDWFFGSRLEPNEIIHLSKNWYWTLMMSWSL